MNVSGPAPIASIQQPDENSIVLRLNQKLTAEVLQVSGDRVVLAINGVQLVARMTSLEQATELVERRQAQFIVKDLASSHVILQLAPKGSEAIQSNPSYQSELAPQLLQNAGLPVNQTTIQIARSLLQAGLQVTPDLVNELAKFLSQMSLWGQPESDLAALLKAKGLPISAESLSLISGSWPSLGELINALSRELKKLQNPNSPSRLAELAKQVLTLLDILIVPLKGDQPTIDEHLRAAVQILGNSIENQMLKAIQNRSPSNKLFLNEEYLSKIYILRQLLEESDNNNLIKEIDRFLDAIRRMQYLNGEPETKPVKESWLKIELPISLAESARSSLEEFKDGLLSAHIQIAYLPDGERKIDPCHTRCIVRVELTINDIIQVDATVADRRIGVRVTTSTPRLLQKAKIEMPSLKNALEAMGYTLQSSDCRVENFPEKGEMNQQPSWHSYFEVQVEV